MLVLDGLNDFGNVNSQAAHHFFSRKDLAGFENLSGLAYL